MVLSHIEALKAGSKISVRGLASELEVSEGTVYKAIKEAEARGLVITKPQSGTFRIESAADPKEKRVSLADVSGMFAASVAAGKRYLNHEVSKIVLCDGDEKQLDAQLAGREEGQILCIVGNRPDMQETIVDMGADMLITGGAKAADSLIIRAESTGVCILCTVQSTFTVLCLFDGRLLARGSSDGEPLVSDWMETPDYLYRNDIAADWQRFYHNNLRWLNYYPIVDDELHICGGIDISQAFNAPDSQRLSSLLADNAHILTVDASCPVRELARKMILTGVAYAAVVRDGRMDGVVFSSDLIRFFMLSGGDGTKSSGYGLNFLPDYSTEDRLVYELSIPTAERGDVAMAVFAPALAAVEKHLALNGCIGYKLDSSSFFSPESIDDVEALMLATSLTMRQGKSCTAEFEIYSENHSYAKGMLVYSA